jgi:hypothetical protein
VATVKSNCEVHAFEVADDRCGQCGHAFCSDCIVYPWGPRKPPLCKSCAIAVAGIRKHASRPPVASRRNLRREARARKKERRAQQAALPQTEPVITGDVDWGAPAAPPPSLPEPPRASAGMGFDDDDLQVIRPAGDAHLSSVQ